MAEQRFKVGDRVVVNCSDESSPKGTIGTIESQYGGLGGGNLHVRLDDGSNDCWLGMSVDLVTSSWDSLSVGDILIDDENRERQIYAVVGQLIALDDGDKNDKCFAWEHVDDVRGWDYKLKGSDPEVTELSVAEIEKRLELASGTLRVKKD